VSQDVAWARSEPACLAREVVISVLLRPLIATYTRREVTGRDHLASLTRPVVFVANHCSHMDTPLILGALPRSWRRRTAVAAAADHFYTRPLLARTVSLAFNTVPVQRKGQGAPPDDASLLTRLLDERWSLLVFAEGTRSRSGDVGRLRSGAALLATRHDLAIVPVYVAGTHATMPAGSRWMRRGSDRRRQDVRIAFGLPIRPAPDEHRTDVMERVRLFFESEGATTTPDKRIVARSRRSAATASDRP